MKKVDNFFNKLASEIDKTFFKDIKYYGDDKNCAKAHYSIELFNNGCLSYDKLILRLAKSCETTNNIIHNIVKNYVDFEGYEYKP